MATEFLPIIIVALSKNVKQNRQGNPKKSDYTVEHFSRNQETVLLQTQGRKS